MTTNISAADGALSAMIASWIFFKKPDPSFTLNGTLAVGLFGKDVGLLLGGGASQLITQAIGIATAFL